ncbi:putative glyoxalase superfamily protein PhnB [Lentzea atacamensis]|uniref:Putative glyoxalase superfamily protein PhnB n=1 Tax=Lentzea atacamensis TaxID=531938 RepID=A0A316I482_9PSEU|nr:VOC family protein [Lentzea atacamensis]PWK88015.1 putative glyoxalase superfamily protein PhnB [Lentzea atacamensis]
MTTLSPTCWPTLSYQDAPAAIRFLVEAFGFSEHLVVPGEAEGEVVHCEMVWPEGGGVMLGSTVRSVGEVEATAAGAGSVYVVTDRPDEIHVRCMARGATEIRGLRDEDYGSRGFTVADPEGNRWSFGTYRGA